MLAIDRQLEDAARPPGSGHACDRTESEALGEPLEDPLLLFPVLYGFWVMALTAFAGDGKIIQEISGQFLALAEKQERLCRSWSAIASWAIRSFTRRPRQRQSAP